MEITAVISFCLIIGFFVLTSRVYKLLNNAREIREHLQAMREQQRADAEKLNAMRDALVAMRRYYEPPGNAPRVADEEQNFS